MALELMVDTIVVEYQTGSAVQSEATGVEAAVYAVRFTTPARFAGDDELHMPAMGPEAQNGDRVTVTLAGADPELLGRQFFVVGEAFGSHETARRYVVKAASR